MNKGVGRGSVGGVGSGPMTAAVAAAAQKQKPLMQTVETDIAPIVDNFSYLANVPRCCTEKTDGSICSESNSSENQFCHTKFRSMASSIDMNLANSVSANINSVPLLSSNNFHTWKLKVEIALCCMNIDMALYKDCPQEPGPESTVEVHKVFEDWQQSNRACRLLMLSSISDSLQQSLQEEKNAKKMLETLVNRYTHITMVEITETIKKFSTIRYKGDGDIREYIQQVVNLHNKLKSLKVVFPEDYLVPHVLFSLPPQYNHFEVIYNCQQNKWTLDQLTIHLVHEQTRLRNLKQESVYLATTSSLCNKKKDKEIAWSGSQKKQKGSNSDNKAIKCFFCKKAGHMKKDCAKYKTWCDKKGLQSMPESHSK